MRMPEDASLLIEAVYGEYVRTELPKILLQDEFIHHFEIQRKTNKSFQ